MAILYCLRRYLLVLLVVFAITDAREKLRIRMTNVNCNIVDHDTVGNLTCSLTDEPVPKVSATGILKRELKDARIQYKLVFVNNGKKEDFVGDSLDLCTLFSSKGINVIVGNILEDLKRISNVPTKCPLPANTEYYMRNLTINNNLLATVLGERTAYVKGEFYSGNTLLLNAALEIVCEKINI